jgi:hypothetical protein
MNIFINLFLFVPRFFEFRYDRAVILGSMGQIAARAAFHAGFAVLEVAAAPLAQKIQRAKAKNAVERIFVFGFVAREVSAFAVAEKFMAVFHTLKLSPSFTSFT